MTAQQESVADCWLFSGRPREEEYDIRVFVEALAPWLGQRPPSGTPITEPTQLRAVTEQSGLDVDRVDRVVCPSTTPTRRSCSARCSTRHSAGRSDAAPDRSPCGRPCSSGWSRTALRRGAIGWRTSSGCSSRTGTSEAAPSGGSLRACEGEGYGSFNGG